MTDTPNPDGRDDHSQGAERDIPADDGPDYRDDPWLPGPTEDIHRLSPGEERDLHFNGFPPYDLQPLHELCPVGGCPYKTLEENIADLDWHLSRDREPDRDDPEAGL